MSERLGIWRTSLRLPPRVKAAVRRAAAAQGCSMNRWMVRELERHVAEMEKVMDLAPDTKR